jgi:hypothetical protein
VIGILLCKYPNATHCKNLLSGYYKLRNLSTTKSKEEIARHGLCLSSAIYSRSSKWEMDNTIQTTFMCLTLQCIMKETYPKQHWKVVPFVSLDNDPFYQSKEQNACHRSTFNENSSLECLFSWTTAIWQTSWTGPSKHFCQINSWYCNCQARGVCQSICINQHGWSFERPPRWTL